MSDTGLAPTPGERARRLLAEAQNLVLATAGPDGEPWIAPLFFVAGAGAIYWTSEPQARHSQHVRANPHVAIVVYADAPGRPVDGVYLRARVTELSDAAANAEAIERLAAKPQPERWRIRTPADVADGGPWRIYRARILSAEVRRGDTVAGRPVARREPVELAELF